MEYTRKLAGFCAAVSLDSLPPEVIRKAKLCLLDYAANIYGSLELDAVAQVIAYVKSLGAGGPATAFGCGFKTDLHHAAFINGTTAEAIEAQDGLRFGGNHPGTSVIPAALALAETRGLDGSRVVEAIVAGYEAANRPAAAMHPWHTLSGFLPTGTCGAFGAAAAAARMLGFDPQLTATALGNAGYLLPLSMAEQLMGGYTIKIVQGGAGALAGLMAAGLARHGLTGLPGVFEGTALGGGFCKITSQAEPRYERIVDGLGEHYSIMDIYFKPFTACRHTHGAAQAVLELVASEKIDPTTIEAVHVYTYGIAELAVGKGINKDATFVSAQFSIPYVVAACLLDGRLGPGQLTEKRLADPEIMNLAQKVGVSTDPELNAAYPEKTSSRVEVRTRDGRSLARQVDIPRGDPRDPMDEARLTAKVKAFAGDRDAGRLDALIENILNLEKLSDIKKVTEAI
jgi:2-methylcitrate dehydratase PrpD